MQIAGFVLPLAALVVGTQIRFSCERNLHKRPSERFGADRARLTRQARIEASCQSQVAATSGRHAIGIRQMHCGSSLGQTHPSRETAPDGLSLGSIYARDLIPRPSLTLVINVPFAILSSKGDCAQL